MAAPAPVRIAVVDDHWMVRATFEGALKNIPGYELVFCAEHGEDYIKKSREQGAPDIVLVDLMMPVMDGWVTIAWIREHQKNTKPVALTVDPHEEAVRLAWKAGACATLSKALREAELQKALDDVRLVGYHHNDLVQHRLVQKDVRQEANSADARIRNLSKAELRSLELMAHEKGYSGKEIADRTNVEYNTFATRCRNIYAKLEVRSRAQAVGLFNANKPAVH